MPANGTGTVLQLTTPGTGYVTADSAGVWADSTAVIHDDSSFAGPVWIGARGSTVPDVKRQAARDLLTQLDTAEKAFTKAYDGVPAPTLRAHYAAARTILDSLAAPARR